MEQQFPKNVRQIGNVSDSPKIYVEDYVDTFLNQLCDYHSEEAIGVFLVGTQVTIEDQPCVYISGAVRMDELPVKDGSPVIDDEYVKKMREEKEKYFHDGELIGWFLALPGQKAETNENIIKIHEKTFPKTNTVFIIRDTAAKEEMFFAYKYHDLLEIGGHYIYYEKNPDMQNYMITKRRQTGMTPSEVVEDQAAKNFRSLVREKMKQEPKRKAGRLQAAATTLVLTVAVVIGVSLFNNYDKMRSAQKSLGLLAMGEAQEEPLKSGSEELETIGTGQALKEQLTPEEILQNETEAANEEQAAAEQAGIEKTSAEQSGEGQADDKAQGADGETQAAAGQPQEQQAQDVSENGTNSSTDNMQGGSILEEEAVEASSGVILGEDDFYVVQKGDTLDSISKKVYGDISHVDAICRMNGLQDGNLIFIGQKILLP